MAVSTEFPDNLFTSYNNSIIYDSSTVLNNNNNNDNDNDYNNDYDKNNELFLSGWPHFHSYGLGYWAADLFIIVMGSVGNVLQFILMCDRGIEFLSYSVYLKFLSVSDTLVLIAVFLESTEEGFGLRTVTNTNDLSCKLLNWFRFATKLLSPWLMVGLTLDRCVVVCFPLSRDRLCTRTKAAVVCLCLVCLSVVFVLPVLVQLQLRHGECAGPDDLEYYLIFIRLFLSSLLPCFFILILNAAIVVRIQRSKKFRSTFLSSRHRQESATRPLIFISGLAFVTLLPVSVAETADAILKLTRLNPAAERLGEELWPVWNVIYRLSFAQTFYILVGSAYNYRNIMKSKFRCCRKERKKERENLPCSASVEGAVNSLSRSVVTENVIDSTFS